MRGVVGRVAELAAGDAFVRAIDNGPALLLLEGEAGIGKTTVWAAIADRVEASGAAVYRSQPAAAETSLTLSALADLLERVPEDALAPLPRPQRRAIDAALLRADPAGDALGQRLLGTAVRSVLVELAQRTPVVLAIDDAQWVDSASASTLGFALRRIGAARIGVLAARRLGPSGALDLRSLPASLTRRELSLGPLSLGTLHHVLKDRLGRTPARSTLVRIHEASGGNPLFALEIAQRLLEAGEPPADQPLPVPRDVRELVHQRIQRLPETTRRALLAAALQAAPTMTSLSAALGGEVADDLAIAERGEIVRLQGEHVVFGHPLFAAAVSADATDADRRQIHRSLAQVVEGAEERARHRALATLAPNADVAAELERAANAAAARAAPLAAADLMRHALLMTPAQDAAAIDDRKLTLGRFLKLGGDLTESERVLEDAAQSASTRLSRARARVALANVVLYLDPSPRCARLAAEALADADGDVELMTEAHATLAAVDYDDWRQATHHAREAKRLLAQVPDPSPALESFVLHGFAAAEIRDGGPWPVDAIERALELERIAPPPVVSDRLSASLGYWLFLTDDDLEGGRRWMEATYAAAVEEGDEGSIPFALSHLPLLEFAAGNWATAEECARHYLVAATDAGQDSERLGALFALAQVLVHQGRESEARPLIEELLRDAAAAGSLWDVTKALVALGALELSLGNAEAAVEHLSGAEEGRDRLGDERNSRHEADLIEALITTGRIDEAREVVMNVERRARRFGRHSRLAVAARSRALLSAAMGQLDDAIAALDEALREHALAPFPFERARSELVLGRVRRRRRERTLAKAAFESALATFETLGATLWARRTRAELDRVGLRRSSGTALTEGERRVAELLASGRTVAEVAALLFVSRRTAEANLSRAYRKLGISSRAELGAVMAAVPGSQSEREQGLRVGPVGLQTCGNPGCDATRPGRSVASVGPARSGGRRGYDQGERHP